MPSLTIDVVPESQLEEIRPLLLDLLHSEQNSSAEVQVSRESLEQWLPATAASFQGRNHIYAARLNGRVVGFCWCVIFDPGTGLEGEVAELYVEPGARGQGLAGRLVQAAVELFKRERVTFACVWTRPENETAVRTYRRAGFSPTDQLVMTWYP